MKNKAVSWRLPAKIYVLNSDLSRKILMTLNVEVSFTRIKSDAFKAYFI
jgi:hypothetical protein